MLWKIILKTDHQTAEYAAEELKHYLPAIDPAQQILILRSRDLRQPSEKALQLSVDESLLPEGSDPVFDDAYRIDVENGVGSICGSNPRSILLGVYRFLKELGCAWIRPGRENEYIPHISLNSVCVQLTDRPSYRHRGMTIEGSVSYDHVIRMIDWLPKVGMNSYFIQFPDVPFAFYDRWYSHQFNPELEPTPLSMDEIRAIRLRTIDEIKKRGLLFHAAGHGWTCEPFGISGHSWDSVNIELTDEQRSCLAEVNGKRELWGGVPLNTNLCYSKLKVRQTVAKAVVEYCRKTPQIDVVHLWLADGTNNSCECPDCVKKSPSDWYILLLNEVDRQMTEAGMKQKVVFLIYVDLLWPPVHETLSNPERFILMFAPITRTYSASMADAEEFDEEKLPAFVRNHLAFPESVGENVAWLRQWQKKISTDSFDFDYHYMWDHFNDPGYFRMGEVLLKDIRGLEKIGLNGLVSCQPQRTWFPTSLGMHLMAEGLWDKTTDFDDASDRYFLQSFGRDGLLAKDYLCRISDAFEPKYLRDETGAPTEADEKRLSGVEEMIEGFADTIRQHTEDEALPDACRRSWQLLADHAEYCRQLALSLLEEIHHPERGRACYDNYLDWCNKNEDRLSDVLDVFEAHIFVDRRMRKK